MTKTKCKMQIPDFLRYKYRHCIDEPWSDYKLELPDSKIFRKVVTIMRANPPHVNHIKMLENICKLAVEVNINIGSSNKFDNKNPCKTEEREEMLNRVLRKKCNNYELLRLPDFDDDDKWFGYLQKINEDFTEILSNNDYDLQIYERNQHRPGLEDEERRRKYDIIFPTDVVKQDDMLYITGIWNSGKFVPTKNPLYVSGTFVRAAIVNDWGWENFLNEEVADYINKNNLVERLKSMCPELKGMPLEKFETGR